MSSGRPSQDAFMQNAPGAPTHSAPIQNDPRQSMSSHIHSQAESNETHPIVDPAFIDTSSPDDIRTSFRTTDYDSLIPQIRARYPHIDPLYFTKTFRGTITAPGLVWFDVDRQDATPPDFINLAHLMYCFEIYSQLVATFASPQGVEAEMELQKALSDYRLRILKYSRWATFESLRDWHKATLETQIMEGQDRPEGWRSRRPELEALLRKQMT
ncbi:MAG: hypothetical protein L6R37_005978 [Teloschistes peruensis]|nr:MAG: hypothetical protein L6R37_005978 [Teloschistes peruensis]